MYTRQETSKLTRQFWTSFGMYMAPVLSADGEMINWVNYKTGQKDIRFIMTADTEEARISITLSHVDIFLQQQYFDRFIQLKKTLNEFTGEEWQWKPVTPDHYGKTISEIYTMLPNVSVLNKTDWPAIISFLKPRMIVLDTFWCAYKTAFDRSAF